MKDLANLFLEKWGFGGCFVVVCFCLFVAGYAWWIVIAPFIVYILGLVAIFAVVMAVGALTDRS